MRCRSIHCEMFLDYAKHTNHFQAHFVSHSWIVLYIFCLLSTEEEWWSFLPTVILVSVWTLVFIWCHKIIIKWAPWGFGSCIHFTFRVTNLILKTTVIKTHWLTCFTNGYISYCNFNFKTTECWQTIYLLYDACNDTRKGRFTSGLLNYIFLRARLFNWKFGGGQIFFK